MLKLKSIRSRLSSTERFRAAESVTATQQADATILVDLKSGRYYTLNPVSGRIWSILTEGGSLEHATHRVKEEFDTPDEEQLTAEVEEFVRSLLSAKLIRRDN